MIELYTDGANSLNGQPWSYGGCGWLIVWDGIELEGGLGFEPNLDQPVTNNRMELSAILDGLKVLVNLKVKNESIKVWSDSQWCVQCASGTWRKKKNLDLWSDLAKLIFELRKRKNTIEYRWVKGHAGHHYNERVDDLAVMYKSHSKPSLERLEELKNMNIQVTL